MLGTRKLGIGAISIPIELQIGLAVLIVVGALLVYAQKSAKDRAIKLREKLLAQFGEPSARTYEESEFKSISHYFETHKDDRFFIDDITWNDCDFNRIFQLMNNTQSSAGEEYLYYKLRTPSFSNEELQEFGRLVQFFDRHEEERLTLQSHFHEIGHTVKISLSAYIDHFKTLDKRSNLVHYFSVALLLFAIGVFAVEPTIGILIVCGALVHNVARYYSVRAEIESYFICISYIVRVVKAAKQLGSMKIEPLEAYLSSLRENAKPLEGMIARAKWIGPANNYGGGLIEMLLEYVRMAFHVDLIQFNALLRMVQSHGAEVEALVEQVGQLESAIAVASFRRMLPYYAEPELSTGKDNRLELTDGYHPLLSEPVANSIMENRCVLLTGSNASGKSTFLKTVAIAAILAQTIDTVPALAYRAIFYRVYSSMALRDDLEQNESYYMVEIKSLKRVMSDPQENAPVLCFVDEVLRGTNTVERVAASSQILYHMAKSGAMCFAATHDIELTHLLEREYSNYHFREEVVNDDILFNYILNKGRATTRNAIKLLQIMGYDSNVIQKADATAAYFLEKGEWRLSR